MFVRRGQKYMYTHLLFRRSNQKNPLLLFTDDDPFGIILRGSLVLRNTETSRT